MLCLVTGQKQQESPVPFCHPYQVPSYLRACHSLSRRIAASRLKPSSSSSSSDTPRSSFNFTWYVKPGSNGDRRPPILRGRSQLLARWQETQELETRSLRGCRVTWKKKKNPEKCSFRGCDHRPPCPASVLPSPAGHRLSPPTAPIPTPTNQRSRQRSRPAYLSSNSQSDSKMDSNRRSLIGAQAEALSWFPGATSARRRLACRHFRSNGGCVRARAAGPARWAAAGRPAGPAPVCHCRRCRAALRCGGVGRGYGRERHGRRTG